MIDKNINYNKYFLRLVKDFEESTAPIDNTVPSFCKSCNALYEP